MKRRGRVPFGAAVLGAVLAAAAGAAAGDDGGVIRRVAFGSCLDQNKKQPVWDAVAKFRPDLFIFTGDVYYPQDPGNMEKRAKDIAKVGASTGFQKLRNSVPILATWGDDDFGIDDPLSEPGKREAVRRIFLDFFKVPAESPRRTRPGIWDAVTYGPPGKRLQVILLDTRFNRTPLKKRFILERATGPYAPSNDPYSTYLGEEQWAFLREQLLVPADLRLIVSDIQVAADEGNYEKWANFPHERQRLFSLLLETKAQGVIVLSGERHLAEISEMDAGLGYPLLDVTASGLNMAAYNVSFDAKNRYRVQNSIRSNNFGAILIEWDRPEPRVTIELRDEDGSVPLSIKVPLGSFRTESAPAAAEKF